MVRLIRWQTLLAALGILIVVGLLAQFSLTRQTIVLPVRGGTYVEGVVGTPQYLNPLLATSDADRAIAGLLFEGLSQLQPDGSILPALAEGWETSPDGTVYTCTLRSEARWHDGEPVTTADVLLTLEIIRSPDFPDPYQIADLWSRVTVEALDDRRLRFTLEQPYAPFLSYTTLPVLPAHLLEGTPPADFSQSAFNLEPVGTGPFRFVEAREEEGTLVIDLKDHPFYHRRSPYLEGVQFRFYRDEATLVEALLEEEIDGVFGLSTEGRAQIAQEPELTVYHTYLQAYTILFLNTQSSLLIDSRVRHAIAHGLDQAALLEGFEEEIFLANGPISPISWAYKPDLPPQEQDLPRATTLLEESGWLDQDKDGIRERDVRSLELTLITHHIPEMWVTLAHRIKQQLAPLGIVLRVIVLEDSEAFNQRIRERDYDLLLYGWRQLGRDPDEFALWHSSQIGPTGWNLSSLDNQAIDQLLQKGRTTLDRERRTQLYWRFQEQFLQEVPAIPLYYPVHTFIVRTRIRNVDLPPLNDVGDRFHGIHNWYINTQQITIGTSRSAPRYEGGGHP